MVVHMTITHYYTGMLEAFRTVLFFPTEDSHHRNNLEVEKSILILRSILKPIHSQHEFHKAKLAGMCLSITIVIGCLIVR